MPFTYPEIRSLHGLYLQPNTFTVPDGAMEVANNVVVKNQNLITSRRGNYQYFAPNSGTLNKLIDYQNTLLSVYSDKMAYYTDTGLSPNETGVEHAITGETVLIDSTIGGTSRNLQSNSNLYVTTSLGVLKLPAFNGTLAFAGAPPGLDVGLNFEIGSPSTWLAPGFTVGYRVLFGYTDINNNEILGAPSQIAQITNTSATGVAYARSGGGPYTVTVTSAGHGLTAGQYILVSGGSNAAVNGSQLVLTTPTSSTFTFSVSVDPTASGTLNFGYGSSVLIEISIPDEITTALPWFYRIYRSSQVSTGFIFDDFQLIDEEFLTSAQITARVLFFTDNIDDILRGTELYTNENSGEGELQANLRPPLCQDVTYFKNYAMYANCTTRQYLLLGVVDPTQMVGGDYVEIKVGVVTRRYVAQTGVANQTVPATVTSSTGLLINYTAHGLTNGETVYVSNIVGGTLTAGTYFVVSGSTNSFKISLTSGGSAIAYNGETSLYFEGVTNGTYPIFYISSSASASVRLRDTAVALTKAVNRDTSSVVYGQYTSGINQVPGQMTFLAQGFTGTIFMRANTTQAGSAFSPSLPNSFASGNQVGSMNNPQPNAIYISKLGEPEAVPIVNFLPAGSKNYAILRILALRDSVIIVKEDGVFRLVGDSLSNFSITLIDGTVLCLANSSVDLLNNQVLFLSNQGICMVSESSVEIISREKIEDLIQPILGYQDLGTYTTGMGYETERLYLITTTLPNSDAPLITYVYNILTDEWTSSDALFSQAFIGPNDFMYSISLTNTIQKERKKQTKIDYSDQNYPVHIDSITGVELATAVITSAGIAPKKGDMIVKGGLITWIVTDPAFIATNTYAVVFDFANDLNAGDDEILYASFYKTLKWSPFHGGEVSRMKLFSQFILNLRENSMTEATVSFGGNTYGGSGNIDWVSELVFRGWGFQPWGFFPWGQVNTINLTTGTQPAPIVRTYVSPFVARSTYIQASLINHKAGEALNIQSIAYVVRPYNERVSR